jgi:hypothetical protein
MNNLNSTNAKKDSRYFFNLEVNNFIGKNRIDFKLLIFPRLSGHKERVNEVH